MHSLRFSTLLSSLVLASLLNLRPALAEKIERFASDSNNQVVILSDLGISPPTLRMKKLDSFVFFLNETKDALTTIEVDYGSKRTHCASSNLELTADGKARSKVPFGPKDFAVVCLPDKGSYALKVYGIRKAPEGISSAIIVE